MNLLHYNDILYSIFAFILRLEINMRLCIDNIIAWYPEQVDLSQPSYIAPTAAIVWPKLTFVPAMQRRRLSPFAKMVFHTAEQVSKQVSDNLPIIFSSRHGDLHKTLSILADISVCEAISPTAFGLSVHNAAPSLYSIFKENKEQISVVSAGADSFFMALIDTYARLQSHKSEKVLLIHADQSLPDIYQEFRDEQQIDHSLSMVLNLPDAEQREDFELSYQRRDSEVSINTSLSLPAALAFFQWWESHENEFHFTSQHYQWCCKRNV